MDIHKKKILVVEDETEMRELIVTKLKKSGYEVYEAGDGAEALRLAQEVLPDLILSDVILPVMDGLELLEKLRETYFGRDIPFVVITAKGYLKDYIERIGVDGFIAKPCLPEEFLNKVEQVLACRQQAAQMAALAKKILVVDSHPEGFDDLMKLLDAKGSRVDYSSSPAQVVAEAIKLNPDLIIIEFCVTVKVPVEHYIQALRKIPQFKKTPLLIYSHNGQNIQPEEEITEKKSGKSIDLNRILEDGATEYIGAFDDAAFLTRIDTYLRRMEIIVIDDDQGLTQLLKVELHKEGYKVETAQSGEKGLELVKRGHPRLIFLDLSMPGMSGYEVLGTIKNDQSLRDIQVIILTVRGEENAIQKALDLGAHDYIIKPIYIGLLKKRIRVWMNGAKLIA